MNTHVDAVKRKSAKVLFRSVTQKNPLKVCEIVFLASNKMQDKMFFFGRSQVSGGVAAEFVQLMLFPD